MDVHDGRLGERIVDLRSDTITLPTRAMIDAMATASLGDDSRDGDPTVERLEAKAAALLGKEAALFVVSGTMGNLVSLLAQTSPGERIVVEDGAHVYRLEGGGYAKVAGLSVLSVQGEKGVLPADRVEEEVRSSRRAGSPRISLIAVENTHNEAGGTVVRPEHMRALRDVADRYGLRIHVDGARLFNAAVALGLPAAELVKEADSVSFCLSKGLSAPVGSVIVGTADFIAAARQKRRILGGGMRQAGVLAAAGIVALDTMVERLRDDHRRARMLAEQLAALDGLDIDLHSVQTNIVNVSLSRRAVPDTRRFVSGLAELGVRVGMRGEGQLRLVTHRHIDDGDVGRAVAAFAEVLRAAA